MAEISWGPFLAFLLAGGIISIGVVRGAHFLYAKLVTCHRAKYHLKYEGVDVDELTPGEDYEKLSMKIILLSVYNFIVVITTTGFLFLYTVSPLGASLDVGLEIWIAVIFVTLIMNMSLRISSLADLELQTDYYDNIVDRSLSFGYSFILTIYFMTFFGMSTHVIQNGLSISLNNDIVVSDSTGMWFTLLLFVGPLISAIISEAILHPTLFNVREDGFDQLN
ncbi:hypothetical protein G6M89_02420 [Natronolimnobius sp. AArcel1]|uniref:hypothetical protein n=1 Tax=Natronolimnobius sp. AArcel1 TaxID=1679093 RepID=UPI0013ECF00E|nr:hypothetical protein [Natronolimnobius sp. AArcel1]NGM67875.1 hypothetical protein [Natronolimnobius sp. AArcel1]